MPFHPIPGATPLDPDEMEGLLPQHITQQNDLNEWEQDNIINAEIWIFSKKHAYEKILTTDFTKKLHKKMFDATWRWAGKFRQTAKNIGVEPYKIAEELKNLITDVQYQIEYHSYAVDEIAYRFHHRLVKIHPFPNGNGRHARLMTDLLLISLAQTRFSWGKAHLAQSGPVRDQYIAVLRQADKGDYQGLAQFVRS